MCTKDLGLLDYFFQVLNTYSSIVCVICYIENYTAYVHTGLEFILSVKEKISGPNNIF